MTYNIDIYDNHLILISNNGRYLIDTGSPVTISNSEKIDIKSERTRYERDIQGLILVNI